MSEVEVNGAGGGAMDFTSTKTILASSSTSQRIAHLHLLEERLSNDGMFPEFFYHKSASYANAIL